MSEQDARQTPGDLIREKLSERGWTQADLAKILGRHVPAINEIMSGKRGITAETAVQVGLALDTDPQELLALESSMRLGQVDIDEEVIKHRKRLFSIAPVKDMEKRGWIKPTEDASQLESELCRFFGQSSLAEEPHVDANLRSSFEGPINPAQRAWCARAKQLARALKVDEFTDRNFAKGLKQLRRLAAWPDNASKVPSVLASMGIRFVVIEPLPKTRIDGAALWLDEQSPVIVLSIRFDRIDSFWHTLGHEISHISHRDGEALDVDMVGESRPSPPEQTDIERRADNEAAATWIDPEELQSFIVRVGPLYSRDRINQFASRLKIHPGIIVGQLQHRGELGYQALRDALVKIREPIISEALTDGWGHTIQVA